jgi:hypothetical protein
MILMGALTVSSPILLHDLQSSTERVSPPPGFAHLEKKTAATLCKKEKGNLYLYLYIYGSRTNFKLAVSFLQRVAAVFFSK